MIKLTQILLGTAIVGLCAFGWCGIKGNIKISEQKETVYGLGNKIKRDSVFSEKLKKSMFFYADSLAKTRGLYKRSVAENEKLNKKNNELFKIIKKDNFLKGLEGKYNLLSNRYNVLKNEKDNLANKYDVLKNEKDKLSVLYTQALASSSKNISVPSKNEYSNIPQYKETKKKFDPKNQNFFRDWKSISPKLFSIGEESVSFKDNNSKGMEAFAKYETGRLVPLQKIEDSDKSSSFYLPYIDFEKGTIFVYAIDKDGNTSKEYSVYILDGIVSKNKFE